MGLCGCAVHALFLPEEPRKQHQERQGDQHRAVVRSGKAVEPDACREEGDLADQRQSGHDEQNEIHILFHGWSSSFLDEEIRRGTFLGRTASRVRTALLPSV